MYEITIINEANGRDTFQYESRAQWERERTTACHAVLKVEAFSIDDEFSRRISYAAGAVIGVMSWGLKQAIRGNVKEQITVLAAQGAAQMEASPPGSITPPTLKRYTRPKTGRGK